MDFTLEKYKELLEALRHHGHFTLRHDVDLYPERSLKTAELEARENFHATYYFRTVPESYDEEIIRKIVSLGHTAGYHYECLTTCKGDLETAYKDFCNNLNRLRTIVPVSSACAHGSPRSKWNSQDIWNHYDIHKLGINHESMLDTDFTKVLYLTDTGRRWDGYKVSVRDKVPQYQNVWKQEGLVFHTTNDIIQALKDINHPIQKKELLINTHPQRWMPFGVEWIKEAFLQNSKNIIKRIIVSTK